MRRALLVVLVLIVLLGGLWLAGSRSRVSPSGPSASPGLTTGPSAAPSAPAPAGPTEGGPAGPHAATPPRRVALPVHPRVAPSPGVSTAPLLDRRERPPADAAEERQAIQDLLADVDADAAACLAAWSEVDPDAGGTLVLGLNLGPDGLTDAWLEDPDAVPGETLTCLTAAVERHSWANLVSAPAEVTRRLEVPAAR